MAVRYKFRSSVNFDTVDIDGLSSISIRDLKSKIVQSKKLNICQDFDLVFADALTGQEYTDENFQISSGSSVIIKRVPARLVPTDKAYNSSFVGFGADVNEEVKTSCPVNVEINFDDFGIDLSPVPEANLSCSNIDVDKNEYIDNRIENVDTARCSEPPAGGCKKIKASELSETIPRGSTHSANKENKMLEMKSKPDAECIKMGNALNMQNANFPSELKCSLCNTLFKEAVMIPCCQHSFCLKCIHSLLVEKARCPKCFSSKCRAEDLLPNVSLRQAIEHFLESQIQFDESDNALRQYAPDGESGIQAKGMFHKEPELPDSPSATGRGSNYIVADEGDSLFRNNASVGATGHFVNQLGADKFLKSCSLPSKVNRTDGERLVSAHPINFKSRALDLEDFAECQGESQPVNEEAEYIIKKKRGLWINTSGSVGKNFQEIGRYKKGDRTCYMCGSPDHFIRDCPAALNSNPMFQTGNAVFPGAMHGKMSPYWNGPPFHHTRPLANIYGDPGMMPFNATMVPVAPYAVPTYMPSMFASVPAYSGFMTMRGTTARAGFSMEHRPSCLRTPNFQDREKKRTLENEYMRSEQFSDGVDKRRHPGGEAERLHDLKSHAGRERNESYSEENGHTYRSHGKNYRDNKLDDDKHSFDGKHEKSSRSSFARDLRPYHHLERLSSEVEDMPSSSSWHGDDRHRKRSISSKKHNERLKFHDDWSHHPTNREKDVERKRVKFDAKRHGHKHNSHSESDLEPSYNSDEKRRHRKKDLSRGFRHSRHNPKSFDDDLNRDRWLMVRGSNEDGREDYRSYKRKRVY